MSPERGRFENIPGMMYVQPVCWRERKEGTRRVVRYAPKFSLAKICLTILLCLMALCGQDTPSHLVQGTKGRAHQYLQYIPAFKYGHMVDSCVGRSPREGLFVQIKYTPGLFRNISIYLQKWANHIDVFAEIGQSYRCICKNWPIRKGSCRLLHSSLKSYSNLFEFR